MADLGDKRLGYRTRLSFSNRKLGSRRGKNKDSGCCGKGFTDAADRT
jgi:hypothetical protein